MEQYIHELQQEIERLKIELLAESAITEGIRQKWHQEIEDNKNAASTDSRDVLLWKRSYERAMDQARRHSIAEMEGLEEIKKLKMQIGILSESHPTCETCGYREECDKEKAVEWDGYGHVTRSRDIDYCSAHTALKKEVSDD